MALTVSSCFTGVDSTPRIGAGEVRNRHAADSTAEQLFMSSVNPAAPANWTIGQTRFLIDEGAPLQRIFDGTSSSPESLDGRILTYQGFSSEPSLTGDSLAVILLTDRAGNRFNFKSSVPVGAWDTISRLELPYMLSLDLVQKLDGLLSGNTYFIRTQHWYDDNFQEVYGLRHIAVTVDSVAPGTSLYPAAVFFHTAEAHNAEAAGIRPGSKRMVLMTAGHSLADNRNFDKLFSFKDPRRLYPDIHAEVWELIVRARVRNGMSRDECRLSLGVPDERRQVPTRGGMREIWQYSQGYYLIFDDGYLSNYRQ